MSSTPQPMRRVVNMSRENAKRLDEIAVRMGMTSAQTLNVIVAQSIASMVRATAFVDQAMPGTLHSFVQGEIGRDLDET